MEDSFISFLGKIIPGTFLDTYHPPRETSTSKNNPLIMTLLQNGQIGLDQSMCQAFSQRVMKV